MKMIQNNQSNQPVLGPKYIPGDIKGDKRQGGFSPKSKALHALYRVDHAGEFGAVQIYQGQIDALASQSKSYPPEVKASLETMLAQEQIHLDWFKEELIKNQVRPSLFMPLWEKLGYGLGVMTARLGEEAMMACTVAVETEIQQHYQSQIEALAPYIDQNPHLKALQAKLIAFRQEEIEHHDLALEKGGGHTPAIMLLRNFIQLGARVAIKFAAKV